MVPVMLTFYDSDLKTVKERRRSKFRGWVVSDLVGGSFRPIFRVSHFGLWLYWPKSESDNVCIIICVWMDRWAGVKFCEKKTGWNVKRALSRLRLNQSMSKCPGRGQNDLLPLQCDSGKSREFIEKTTQKHRFQNNSTTFSDTIPQKHF